MNIGVDAYLNISNAFKKNTIIFAIRGIYVFRVIIYYPLLEGNTQYY